MRCCVWMSLLFASNVALAGEPMITDPLTVSEVVQEQLSDASGGAAATPPSTGALWDSWQETWMDGDVAEGNMSDEFIDEPPVEGETPKPTPKNAPAPTPAPKSRASV
ncbi:MAG: hypothetical protein ACOYKZ_01940 [Chlamydiia bacterium]